MLLIAIALIGQSPVNVKIHEDLAAMRSHDPLAFDRAHPFVGRLLGDPGYFAEIRERYEANPARFRENHHFVWRVVAGGRVDCPPVVPPCPPPVPPDCDGPTPPPAVVPEPSSVVSLSIGLAILLGWRRWRNSKLATM